MVGESNCSHYRQLISRFLDGVLAPEEHRHLFQHLAQCAVCATTLTRYREMEQGMRRMGGVALREGLRERIWQAVAAPPPWRPQNQSWWNRRGRLAVAGGLVVAIGLFLAVWLFPPYARQTTTVTEAPRGATPAVAAATGAPAVAETARLVRDDSTSSFGRNLIMTALDNALLSRDLAIAIPAYLPSGSSIERILVEPQPMNTFHMELVFASPEGSVLRLEHFPVGRIEGNAADLTTAGHMEINGRDWWYGHTTARGNAVPGFVLVNVDSGQVISLQGTMSIDELIRVVESLQ